MLTSPTVSHPAPCSSSTCSSPQAPRRRSHTFPNFLLCMQLGLSPGPGETQPPRAPSYGGQSSTGVCGIGKVKHGDRPLQAQPETSHPGAAGSEVQLEGFLSQPQRPAQQAAELPLLPREAVCPPEAPPPRPAVQLSLLPPARSFHKHQLPRGSKSSPQQAQQLPLGPRCQGGQRGDWGSRLPGCGENLTTAGPSRSAGEARTLADLSTALHSDHSGSSAQLSPGGAGRTRPPPPNARPRRQETRPSPTAAKSQSPDLLFPSLPPSRGF